MQSNVESNIYLLLERCNTLIALVAHSKKKYVVGKERKRVYVYVRACGIEERAYMKMGGIVEQPRMTCLLLSAVIEGRRSVSDRHSLSMRCQAVSLAILTASHVSHASPPASRLFFRLMAKFKQHFVSQLLNSRYHVIYFLNFFVPPPHLHQRTKRGIRCYILFYF